MKGANKTESIMISYILGFVFFCLFLFLFFILYLKNKLKMTKGHTRLHLEKTKMIIFGVN